MVLGQNPLWKRHNSSAAGAIPASVAVDAPDDHDPNPPDDIVVDVDESPDDLLACGEDDPYEGSFCPWEFGCLRHYALLKHHTLDGIAIELVQTMNKNRIV